MMFRLLHKMLTQGVYKSRCDYITVRYKTVTLQYGTCYKTVVLQNGMYYKMVRVTKRYVLHNGTCYRTVTLQNGTCYKTVRYKAVHFYTVL
jgi:hypothetical protein